MTENKTRRVCDIYGDQIQIDGQWFHAQRVFGKSASQYIVGQLVEELDKEALSVVKPDEMVCCGLYRGCSSNEMTEEKIAAFVEAMLNAGGWGKFPMIAGYVETLDLQDVEHCKRLVAEDNTRVWLNELGWSRVVTSADIGTRYIHIDNGHHRMSAAVIASEQLGPVFVPVADLYCEQKSPPSIAMRP